MSSPSIFYSCPQCACVSTIYGNCPEPVAWGMNVNDKEFWLCERCHRNLKDGAYSVPGMKFNILSEIPISVFK